MDRPGLYSPFVKGDLDGPNFRVASIDKYWDRASRSLFWIFLCISLLAFAPCGKAAVTPDAELEGILQKIASRHYRWIAIRSDVLLFFAKAGDPNAMCGGELLYQRLDERMFLTCVDARQELMFIFRTFDRRFDLYLPSQNTVYHGSVFDLEDSPDIESHLKARDLYRALKPMAVDPRRAKIERTNSAITSLDVYGRNDDEGALVRKLYLTPEGDVRGELFYNAEARPVTEIQRYDFRELRGQAGSYDSVIFPKKITITSPETKKGSAIFFTHVKALDTIDPLDFILRTPPGTKEVFLDEKDPRFAASGPANTSKKVRAAPISAPRPKPGDKPGKKITPPPPAEKAVSAGWEEPPRSSVKVPAEKASPKNVDADIALENQSRAESSSGSDPQTTLDPSVAPSLEMGKS